MVKQEVYQTGMVDRDIVGDYFRKIHKKYKGNKHIEVEMFEKSDTRISCLIIDNRMKAFVIERRTEFNNLEFTYGETFK